MRYLQLMWAYAPAWGFGGPVRLMYDYAHWFTRNGCDVQVIAGDVNHDYGTVRPRAEVIDGVRVRRVRTYMRSLVARSLNFVSPAMLVRAMHWVLARPGLAIVHVGELRSPVFLYAALVRRLLPHRVVLVHTASGMLHEKASRLRRGFDFLFMGFLIRSVDLGLAQNDHEAGEYRHFCRRYRADPGKIALLPLHTAGFRSPARPSGPDDWQGRMLLRDRIGLARDACVCIFLGRLHPEKGILRAIEAFRVFSNRTGRKCVLLIVGRNEGFQPQVESRIAELGMQDRIRVVNNVYEERFGYYALADMFLGFPTIFEETMLASVEALSCGTPVVLSSEADMPYVADAGGGFVVEFSLERVVGCMEQIAADPEGFRFRARSIAEARFTEAAACGGLEELIIRASSRRVTR